MGKYPLMIPCKEAKDLVERIIKHRGTKRFGVGCELVKSHDHVKEYDPISSAALAIAYVGLGQLINAESFIKGIENEIGFKEFYDKSQLVYFSIKFDEKGNKDFGWGYDYGRGRRSLSWPTSDALLALAYINLNNEDKAMRLIKGIERHSEKEERIIKYDLNGINLWSNSDLKKDEVRGNNLDISLNALLSLTYLSLNQKNKAKKIMECLEKYTQFKEFDDGSKIVKSNSEDIFNEDIDGYYVTRDSLSLSILFMNLGKIGKGLELLDGVEEHIGFDGCLIKKRINEYPRPLTGSATDTALLSIAHMTKEYHKKIKKPK
jgi:hypothetical protein